MRYKCTIYVVINIKAKGPVTMSLRFIQHSVWFRTNNTCQFTSLYIWRTREFTALGFYQVQNMLAGSLPSVWNRFWLEIDADMVMGSCMRMIVSHNVTGVFLRPARETSSPRWKHYNGGLVRCTHHARKVLIICCALKYFTGFFNVYFGTIDLPPQMIVSISEVSPRRILRQTKWVGTITRLVMVFSSDIT